MAKATKKKRRSPTSKDKKVHGADWIRSHVDAFAKEIMTQPGLDHAIIVGIRRRGAQLAQRVQEKVNKLAKTDVPYGALDITLYRDDIGLRGPQLRAPKQGTHIECSIDNRVVFLVDDVIFTGRTIRAAMDELMDFGRPGAIRLYSLIDRGGRELPIQPDRVGERLTLPLSDRIDVKITEVDGIEGVFITEGGLR